MSMMGVIKRRVAPPAGTLNLTARTVQDVHAVLSGSASANTSMQLQNTGALLFDRMRMADVTPAGEWLSGGTPSDYEVMVTLSSGSSPTGTLNSWLDLTTSRTWSVSASRPGTIGSTVVTSNLSVQIRLKSNHAINVTAAITISAEASVG